MTTKKGPKYGHPVSEETRRKISIAFKGRKLTQEHKDKISSGNMGIVRTPEMRKKYSEAAKNPNKNGTFTEGFTPWNKGKKVPQTSGANNANWKGDGVSYRSLHAWVRRELGSPDKCYHCGTTEKRDIRFFQWANKSHEYQRDLSDWIRLCRPCHRKYGDSYRLQLKEKLR